MKFIYLLLFLNLIPNEARSDNKTGFVKSLLKHVEKSIILILNLREIFSPKSETMIKTLTNQFPLLVIDSNDFFSEDFFNIHQNKIFLMFINEGESGNITEQLMYQMNFLINHFSGKPRPKCLIITFNISMNASHILDFFKFAWSHKFLDIDVIEFSYDKTAIRHRYNPFNESYEFLVFSPTSDELFPDKLKNFYGYELNTILYDYLFFVEIDESSNGKGLWEMVQGMDVQMSKILQDFFNFSIHIVDFVTSNEKLKSMLNLTNNEKTTIDFQVNLFCPLQVAWLMHVDPSKFDLLAETFIYPSSQRLMIKQYGTQLTSVSFNFMTLFNMAAIVLIIKLLVRLFRFDTKTWTSYYVIKIILGCSELIKSKKLGQRMFFLALTFMNVVFLGDIMWGFLHSFLTEKKYFNFESLFEVIEQGITPHIASQTKAELLKAEDINLHELALRSATIRNYEEITKCLERLLGGDRQGCEVLDFLGHILANDFEEPSNRWALSLVDEPLLTGWTTMLHHKHSPYLRRFDLVLRRLFEGGLIKYWRDFYLKRFLLDNKRIFKIKEFSSWSTKRSINDYLRNAGSSPYSILRTYGIGVIVCTLVFFGEVLVKKLRSTFGKRRSKQIEVKEFNYNEM